jgi:hypothetical protein
MSDNPYTPPEESKVRRSAAALARRGNMLLLAGGVGILLMFLCGHPTLKDALCFGAVLAFAMGWWSLRAAGRAEEQEPPG